MEISRCKYRDYIDDMQEDVSDTLEHGCKYKRHYVSDLKISNRAKMVIAEMDTYRLNNNILLSDGTSIPCYEVCDAVLSDTKNIMTGSLVKINDEIIGEAYVMHIMFQPGINGTDKVLKGISKRLASKFPQQLLDKLYIRVRSFEEGFPVAPSGKRDVHPLINEGYSSKCESVTNLLYVYASV